MTIGQPAGRAPRPFLEREEHLERLDAAYAAARAGAASLTFIGGEAGAGKTTLVRRFAARPPDKVTLFGTCDPLETPRPLGPLLDMGPELSRRAGRQMPDTASREDLLAFIAEALASTAAPPVLVFEDVHWADQATIDLLRYMGRRLDRLHALVLATFRDDEVTARGPLAVLLGDLGTAAGVGRLPVPPLSRSATAEMVAGSGLDPDAIYERTCGNPFFVGEVVKARSDSVPPTVRDAVLARVARLSTPARRALEAAAAIGARAEPSLLTAVVERAGTPRWGVQEALAAGFLTWRDDALAFRHDLARSAVAGATEPARRQELHALVLDQLRRRPVADDGHGELVRHAEAAGDDATVLELAPLAAGRAAALSAHREAAALLQKAVDRAYGEPAERRADLLERLAGERYQSGHFEWAVAAHRQAAEVRAAMGDARGQARNLGRVAALCFLGGRYAESESAHRAALEILEALPPGPELARAYEASARVRFMEQDPAGAVPLAERARLIAVAAGDEVTALDAQVTAAASRLRGGDGESRHDLEAALADARARDLEDIAARATLYLGWIPILHRSYEHVEERLAEGLAYAVRRELGYWELLIASARVRWALDQGRWHEVEDRARAVLARREAVSLARAQALVAWGRLRARRGDTDAFSVLDEALAVATEHHRVEPVALVWPARTEAAWLAGDPGRVLAEAAEAARRAAGTEGPWWHGELAFWVRAAGGTPAPGVSPAPPYALSLAGDWAGAARWWRERGCRYEAATALLFAPDPGALREALETLDGLGARPAADYARRRLRALGITGVPRGPRPSTLGTPAGLTRREHEVLLLVAAGMSNSEIATRLFLSPKTVERHLSGILRKLDAGSRVEAAAAGSRLGLLRPLPGSRAGEAWGNRRPN